MEYEIFDPKMEQPPALLSRDAAQAAHGWFMSQKDERLRTFCLYANDRGFPIEHNASSLELLNDFFYHEISQERGHKELSGYAYSLCFDTGVFIGELIIANTSCIHWELFRWGDRREIAYHRSVLMGFNVPHKKYNINPDLLLEPYAQDIIKGAKQKRKLFQEAYEYALARAK